MNLLNDIHIYLIHEGDLINDSGLPVVQTILILENLMQISADTYWYSKILVCKSIIQNTYESMDAYIFTFDNCYKEVLSRILSNDL